VVVPLQNTWLGGCVIVGVGFTVMVKDFDEPSQLFPPLNEEGVTVIFATIDTLPVFVATNEATSPLLPAGRFIEGLSFIHE